MHTIHRLVLLALALPEGPARENYQNKVGPCIFKSIGGSVEQEKNSAPLCIAAFKLLCSNAAQLLPKDYTPSPVRLGQARPYSLGEPLSVSDWEILLETGEKQSYKGEQTVVEAHTPQTHLYRIVSGSFSVYVGSTRVGQLIALDWFGEAAFLGNHYSAAKVVADKKGGRTQTCR